MTTANQNKKIEPESVTRTIYRCPLCGCEEEDYKKAMEHAQPPKESPLPQGLVLKQIYEEKVNYNVLFVTKYDKFHLPYYMFLQYESLTDSNEKYSLSEGHHIQVLGKLGGILNLLSEDEFDKFCKAHAYVVSQLGDKWGGGFKRTTPELEQIIAKNKQKGF